VVESVQYIREPEFLSFAFFGLFKKVATDACAVLLEEVRTVELFLERRRILTEMQI